MEATATSHSKKVLLSVLISSLVVVPATFIAVIYMLAWPKEGGDWLVTKHFDPRNAGILMAGQDDSWAVTLAKLEFAALSEQEKLSLATQTFRGVWDFAKGYGFVKSELEQWFTNTAVNYAAYPVKRADLMHGAFMTFREFPAKDIPKSNVHLVVYRLLASDAVGTLLSLFLWVAVPIVVLLFLLVGIVGIFASKDALLIHKVIVGGLVLVVAVAAWLIKVANDKKIVPAGYFNVMALGDHYVSATGTWRGVNQKIAFPVNVAKIDCFKDDGICREANAELADTALMVNTTDWRISTWDDKEITVDHQSKCNTTKMIINFKDQAVTQIRTPLDPLPADCVTGMEGKFITEMVDGFEAIYGRKLGASK